MPAVLKSSGLCYVFGLVVPFMEMITTSLGKGLLFVRLYGVRCLRVALLHFFTHFIFLIHQLLQASAASFFQVRTPGSSEKRVGEREEKAGHEPPEVQVTAQDNTENKR